ncbi:hypothetical protein DFH09DRAFT_1080178 [Mycena vulgaris]|nr:hypothetical protein DFH09DRAFT_1080178 [Mycena vulgaris]
MATVPVDTGSPLTPLPPSQTFDSRDSETEQAREENAVVGKMDREFAERIMANIKKAYTEEHEMENSILARADLLAKKKSLEPHNILDRGVTPDRDYARFTLDSGFSYLVKKTTADLQSLLKSASGLVSDRKTYFIIDPHSTFIGVLNGAESLAEMHVAWIGLSRRLDLAQSFLDKYMLEFYAEEGGDRPTSPVSTVDGVYERLPTGGSNVERLAFFFENVAHHRNQLPEGYDRDKKELTRDMTPPNRLLRAFPDRPVEERPSTVYYSAEGERREREIPERSSWRSSDSFSLPPETEDLRSSLSSKGKARFGYRPVEKMVEIHEEEEKELEYLDEEEYEAQGPINPMTSIFGSDTPFKAKENFFPARSPPAVTRAKAIPGPNLPNPLQGLAAPSSYGYLNDSASQAGRRVRGWSASTAGATPVNRNRYASVGAHPGTGDQRWKRERDVPPHMEEKGAPSSRTDRDYRQDTTYARTGPGGGDGGMDPENNSAGNEVSRKPRRHRGNLESRQNRDDHQGGDRNSGPIGPRGPTGPSGPPDGGDGGSSDSGAPRYPYPHIAPGAPYGNIVLTIDPKLKIEIELEESRLDSDRTAPL